MLSLSTITEFLPEVLLLGGALLVFLLDAAGLGSTERFGSLALGAILLALLAVLADLGTSGLGALRTIPASQIDVPVGASVYGFSSLGLIFQAIFLVAAGLVALASNSRPSDEPGSAIFFGLLLTATLGMLLVALATDLIFLLLAVEVTGISTYLLVGYPRRSPRVIEAAMKFYIVGALSTALSFFGASLIFGAYGTTSLSALTNYPQYPQLALFGYGFLIAGLGFKLTLVPFHAWAVDVYDGAPDDVSAFLAGGSKKIGFFALLLVLIGPIALLRVSPACVIAVQCFTGPNSAGVLAETVQLAVAVLAVLTMTIGNLLALLQKEMKRMLAYSSISQAGYMLIGLAVGTAPALTGATIQVLAHTLMKTGAFLAVAAAASLGVGPLIEDWRGVGTKYPAFGVAFALMLLSLAGIPLTIGFVSKFVLFSSAVQAEGFFVWLAVAGLLNSAISVFYYARVLKTMFLERAADEGPPPLGLPDPAPSFVARVGYARTAAIALVAIAIVALGVDPGPLLSGIQLATQHFLALGI